MRSRQWDIGVTSVEGPHKDINEDNGFAKTFANKRGDPYTVAVVADGMGGYRAGDEASELVVKAVNQWAVEEAPTLLGLSHPNSHISRSLDQMMQKLNNTLLEWSANGKKAGSTVSILFLHRDHYVIRHIGDSRIYSLSDDVQEARAHEFTDDTTMPLHTHAPQVTLVTEDHSWVAKQMKEGRLSKEEARVHPKRNVLLACLGIEYGCQTYHRDGKIESDQLFLLCSDGFYTQFPESEIEELMRFSRVYEDVQEASRRLAVQAEQRDTKDNVTVVIVRPAKKAQERSFWKALFTKTKE
ncbi:PP2C family protein-serine/threonine phosphatase [Aureibacillus halotolerans]|uniref:Serine/threonine protein phosphatase PrpC n=1 Tax=Aureibacillus halotolerans TaxID=1508390 RepID=A0A4R6UB85_9BACI|nr:PP2C family serine/threonine-protein phosphatase [Aureibacillus halotolerans]TDQ42209.1 serine/threonine protein phosphatase PrpC [Aureibacillus halotolerans]